MGARGALVVKGRLILAAPFSGAGKTTTTFALLGALLRRGVDVRPFKTGPDFVDGRFHEAVGAPRSHNLDLWLLGSKAKGLLARYEGPCALIEGVMGLYDGLGATSRCSTAELAALTGTPVVLVVPCRGIGASARALVEGYVGHQPGLVKGLFLSQVSGAAHAELLRQVLSPLGLPIVGWLPRIPEAELAHRGIGLEAPEDLHRRAQLLVDALDAGLDTEALASVASMAQRLEEEVWPSLPLKGKTIARLEGLGFSGDYAAGLDLLEESGAQVVTFRPGEKVPDADLLWMRAGGVLGDLKTLPRGWAQSLSTFRGKVWAEGLGAALCCRQALFDDGPLPLAGLLGADLVPLSGRRAFGYGTVLGEHPWPSHQLRDYDLTEHNVQERRESTGQLRLAGWRDTTLRAFLAHGHPLSQIDELRDWLSA